ncbi:DUF4124 domain-containing protein [Thiolapillus sp.]
MSSASIPVLGFILFLLIGSSHGAQVYRCTQPDGSISFQQQACTGDGERIETGEAQPVWSSLRSGEKSLHKQYRKRDQERLKHKRKQAKIPAGKKPGSAQLRACWNKRKQLEAVSAKLRRGYSPAAGEGLRRRRDNHQDYLRTFCP